MSMIYAQDTSRGLIGNIGRPMYSPLCFYPHSVPLLLRGPNNVPPLNPEPLTHLFSGTGEGLDSLPLGLASDTQVLKNFDG